MSDAISAISGNITLPPMVTTECISSFSDGVQRRFPGEDAHGDLFRGSLIVFLRFSHDPNRDP